jgi:segregation and condensation protein B
VTVVSPEVQAAVEALLFASDEPLPLARIAEVLEVSPDEAGQAVDAVRAAADEAGRGLAVVEVAGGLRLVTRSELAPVLLRLQRLRLKSRLSRAAVETLAIVAYRQPISRPEIEQLRGVGAESVVAHLLERRLVRVVGRKAAPGRPILYGTTREFLEHFGLRDLTELPPFEVPPEAAAAMARVLAGEAATGADGAPEPPAAGETAGGAPEGEGDPEAEGHSPGEPDAGGAAAEEEGAARHDA